MDEKGYSSHACNGVQSIVFPKLACKVKATFLARSKCEAMNACRGVQNMIQQEHVSHWSQRNGCLSTLCNTHFKLLASPYCVTKAIDSQPALARNYFRKETSSVNRRRAKNKIYSIRACKGVQSIFPVDQYNLVCFRRQDQRAGAKCPERSDNSNCVKRHETWFRVPRIRVIRLDQRGKPNKHTISKAL